MTVTTADLAKCKFYLGRDGKSVRQITLTA